MGAGGQAHTLSPSAPISETTADRNDALALRRDFAVSPETVARLHAERDAAGVGLPGPSASSLEVVAPEVQVVNRDRATHPEPGDRVRVRANLVACVVDVSDISVQYRIETRGANAVVVTRSAWAAMTRGCEVLGFDAVEVVR